MARSTAYGVTVTRSAQFLAALASAAVPGLNPVRAWAVHERPGDRFDVAFIEDERERRWTIRAPRTPGAGADLETGTSLVSLLARRLPFGVPAATGFVRVPEGRAVVHPFLPGRGVDLAQIPPGAGLSAEIGRTIAAIHNLDRGLYDEAGVPSYDSETYRQRRLTDLDRAAATGHVPAGLLSRWERTLEDVSLWRFASTPLHGRLTGDRILATFDDDSDARTGRVRAVTGWENARIADPADDFADLAECAPTEVLDSVLEAYAHSLVERVDSFLVRRARLAAELGVVGQLLAAVALDQRELVASCAAALRTQDRELAHAPAPDQADFQTSTDTASGMPHAESSPGLHLRAVPTPFTADPPSDDMTESIQVAVAAGLAAGAGAVEPTAAEPTAPIFGLPRDPELTQPLDLSSLAGLGDDEDPEDNEDEDADDDSDETRPTRR